MKSLVRALAPVVAVLAALGAAAPAASAKPAHGKATHVKVLKAEKAAKAKQDKAERRLTQAKAKLSREVARKQAAVTRAVTDQRLHELSPESVDALRLSAADDLAALDGIAAAVAAATDATGLETPADQLRALRPEVYRILANRLRHAEQLLVLAAGTEFTGTVEALITTARGYDAQTPKSVLRELQAQIAAVAEVLEPEETDETGDEGDPVDGESGGEGDVVAETPESEVTDPVV